MSTMEHIARDIRDGIFPSKSPRWKLIEQTYCFYVACERDGMHIRIVYGDNSANSPLFGTKDEARTDAETIVRALNARDSDKTDDLIDRLRRLQDRGEIKDSLIFCEAADEIERLRALTTP